MQKAKTGLRITQRHNHQRLISHASVQDLLWAAPATSKTFAEKMIFIYIDNAFVLRGIR